MPTIKDVARLAGVSHGTVSNVINGAKSVNSEIVRKVENAMKELDYQPDAKARSLRISKTNLIGLILPNILDSIYANIYAGISDILSAAGYTMTLFLTNDDPRIEIQALQQLQRLRSEAILTVTCIPDHTEQYDHLIEAGIKVVFISRKPVDMYHRGYIGLEEDAVFYNAVSDEISAGNTSLTILAGNQAFTDEAAAVNGFVHAVKESKSSFYPEMIRILEPGKEAAFRASVWWLQSGTVPDVIFTTGSEYAKGILAAIDTFQIHAPQKTRVAFPDNSSWSQHVNECNTRKLPENAALLGETAAKKAIALIEGKINISNVNILLPASPEITEAKYKITNFKRTLSQKRPLRILMLDGAASYASRLMAPRYTALTGTDVEIESFSYEELMNLTLSPENAESYDIIQVNVSWLSKLAKEHRICSLNPWIKEKQLDCYDNILNIYSRIGSELFAVPYMLDAQLLFYRKDLFDDIRCQRMYYDKYHSDLRVPQTWEEYDRTASFFTQSINPLSPVRYGTTMGGSAVYSVYSLIPRIWELGCNYCVQPGRFDFSNRGIFLALQQYMDSFQYADPSAKEWHWKEQTTSFTHGEAAMMTLYQAHFMDHLNKENTLLNGKIGVSPLPGGFSVRGGWSLSINSSSDNKEIAADYLRWICSAENALPNNILGGSLPGISALDSIEIRKTYPWFSEANAALKKSRMMLPDDMQIPQYLFENALGHVLHDGLVNSLSAEDILKNIIDAVDSFK